MFPFSRSQMAVVVLLVLFSALKAHQPAEQPPTAPQVQTK